MKIQDIKVLINLFIKIDLIYSFIKVNNIAQTENILSFPRPMIYYNNLSTITIQRKFQSSRTKVSQAVSLNII